jgi:aldose 1-epimerase
MRLHIRRTAALPAVGIVLALIIGCSGERGENMIEQESFGDHQLYTLENENGLRVRITNYGGIVLSLEVPDREGENGNVVLGFDTLDEYLAGHPYFGALIGRYGNRIAAGSFRLDGREYELARNNGPNHLHGGERGFDKMVWQAEPVVTALGESLKLTAMSPDGDEGYPGNLNVEVVYTLTADNALRIDYLAITDAPTPVNLTHHSYFNLAGPAAGDILGHEVVLNADAFLPTDDGLIPTGEIRSVEGTCMDFRTPHEIGERIARIEGEHFAGGYDHCYVLNVPESGTDPFLAATVRDPESGRVMEVYTTEPGMQFYTGNFLDGSLTGSGGIVFEKHHGFCLEAQHYPDSPNRPEFPPVILQPGQVYTQTTIYRFSTRR